MPLQSSMVGVGAIGVMTAVLLVVDSDVTHPQIIEHLAFGYMLPIVAVAMLFGSVAGTVATAVSALAAAFFFFPPKFSLWIEKPIHIAELFWLAVLGYVASRAVGGLLDAHSTGGISMWRIKKGDGRLLGPHRPDPPVGGS